MAPILWLALLLGYFAGLGAAFLLLPDAVLRPLHGVLGVVTVAVIVATVLVMVAAARIGLRSAGRGADPPTFGSRLVTGSVADKPLSVDELQRLLSEGRVDILLQPLIGWPEPGIELYGAAARLRTFDGGHLPPARYLPTARRAGLSGLLDAVLILRCAPSLTQAAAAGRAISWLCPVSPGSLADRDLVGRLEQLAIDYPDIGQRLVLEMDHLRLPRPVDEARAALSRVGWRFCLRRIGPAAFDPSVLGARGYSFVRLGPASPAGDLETGALAPELARMEQQLLAADVTLLVDRSDAGPTLLELAEQPFVADEAMLRANTRQSAA